MFFCACITFTFNRPVTANSLKILNPPPETAMTLQFNVIVPLRVWEWEKGRSKIFMRFGHSEFGDWKLDLGPGTSVR